MNDAAQRLTDRVIELYERGALPREIARDLQITLRRVRAALRHPRPVGRPPSALVCPTCGALPCHQRKTHDVE